MELITILVSSLLAIVSPTGLVIDQVIEDTLRSQIDRAEQLEVRLDNTPSYQVLQGKLDKVRIAGRGLWLTPDIRVEALELESDPVNLDLPTLRQGNQSTLQNALRQPLQAGVHLVLTESDLNKALLSPLVTSKLQQMGDGILESSGRSYKLLNPRVDFLGNNHLRFEFEVQEGKTEPLPVKIELGLRIASGEIFELIDPLVVIQNEALPPQLVEKLIQGLNSQFNIRTLEGAGITARLLQLNIGRDELDMAAFIRVEETSQTEATSQGVLNPS
ncbi:MAG: DUF2993 domain-containing protein [Coleofasciculaceae cyanobacterium]